MFRPYEAERNEFPHMVAIGYNNEDGGYDFLCGGSLISEKFVLTSVQCLDKKRLVPIIARLGKVIKINFNFSVK